MGKAAITETKQRRGRPPVRRPAQHAMLLDAAAEQINLGGAASISLAELGAKIGVTRSAMYYYCTDAADLAFQCYVRACNRLQENIHAASTAKGTVDEKLALLMRTVLSPERPVTAVLNDLAYLPDSLQADIRKRTEAHAKALAATVREGQKSGVLRAIDADWASRLILNCLSWTLVSKPWLSRRDDRKAQAHFAETVVALLLNGLALDSKQKPRCELSFETLMSRPINAFDPKQTAEQKADQIISVASRLFNAKGLDGVRLDDVSAELGVTKGAIYHHFRDKTDLIERCYARGFDVYDTIMETGVSIGSTPLERSAIVIHLNTQAQMSTTPPLALQPGLSQLSPARRGALTRRALALNAIGAKSLAEGMDDGSCRQLDATLTSQIFAGYFLGLPQVMGKTVDPTALADFVIDLAAFGLRTRT
jgi:AcrR family transcriptional regulator